MATIEACRWPRCVAERYLRFTWCWHSQVDHEARCGERVYGWQASSVTWVCLSRNARARQPVISWSKHVRYHAVIIRCRLPANRRSTDRSRTAITRRSTVAAKHRHQKVRQRCLVKAQRFEKSRRKQERQTSRRPNSSGAEWPLRGNMTATTKFLHPSSLLEVKPTSSVKWQCFANSIIFEPQPRDLMWYQQPGLGLGAPVFAASLAQLFNQSVVEGVIPRQWKTAVISPIPKVSKPTKPSDYRPISITPVLSRCLEKHVVRSYIYPALHLPHPGLSFDDQFAFRPSGSTTAAVVALLHTVRVLLSSNQFVRVFSFDFTKAFDTVRHASVMTKVAQMQIPDSVYNWINDYFDEHYHSTRYAGQCSTVAEVKASVIQGSGLGPASYLVTAA